MDGGCNAINTEVKQTIKILNKQKQKVCSGNDFEN